MDKKISAILCDIAQLLRQGAPNQADTAIQLAQIADEQPDRFAEEYCNAKWWGADSMAAYEPTDSLTSNRYQVLLVDLVKACDRAGYSCPSAQRWSHIFEKWLAHDPL